MKNAEADRYIEWIRSGLKSTGKTQLGLASHLNLAHPQITQLLKGKRRLKVDEVPRIAEYLGIAPPTDDASDEIIRVPMVSWVSAGELSDQAAVIDLSEYPTIAVSRLPPSRWIALRVDGPSMNKISPPDSLIFVDVNDKRLVTNACYVICDETGAATYKRYRPNEDPPFQPASYEDVPPPKLEGAITVIGRVKRSMIDM
ncbi:helix-turn-helix transcriptional regulator [Mesorhizobium sp. Root552]|uniref:LexA family transcriptional regulator n=1 Tax=Mesorhizobium sp. Root552 TaxID=1736555 RepID=UPI000AE6E9B4|nr:LexA family transcriptional regulator [Mesorhizobium sp. Root552]